MLRRYLHSTPMLLPFLERDQGTLSTTIPTKSLPLSLAADFQPNK
ncbi:hypothetical protein A2U01_0070310, partial [Trifolium medium]|nr:hypothetical protein [Trifolium medium]